MSEEDDLTGLTDFEIQEYYSLKKKDRPNYLLELKKTQEKRKIKEENEMLEELFGYEKAEYESKTEYGKRVFRNKWKKNKKQRELNLLEEMSDEQKKYYDNANDETQQFMRKTIIEKIEKIEHQMFDNKNDERKEYLSMCDNEKRRLRIEYVYEIAKNKLPNKSTIVLNEKIAEIEDKMNNISLDYNIEFIKQRADLFDINETDDDQISRISYISKYVKFKIHMIYNPHGLLIDEPSKFARKFYDKNDDIVKYHFIPKSFLIQKKGSKDSYNLYKSVTQSSSIYEQIVDIDRFIKYYDGTNRFSIFKENGKKYLNRFLGFEHSMDVTFGKCEQSHKDNTMDLLETMTEKWCNSGSLNEIYDWFFNAFIGNKRSKAVLFSGKTQEELNDILNFFSNHVVGQYASLILDCDKSITNDYFKDIILGKTIVILKNCSTKNILQIKAALIEAINSNKIFFKDTPITNVTSFILVADPNDNDFVFDNNILLRIDIQSDKNNNYLVLDDGQALFYLANDYCMKRGIFKNKITNIKFKKIPAKIKLAIQYIKETYLLNKLHINILYSKFYEHLVKYADEEIKLLGPIKLRTNLELIFAATSFPIKRKIRYFKVNFFKLKHLFFLNGWLDGSEVYKKSGKKKSKKGKIDDEPNLSSDDILDILYHRKY